jgi:hypothetical protein
MSKKKQYLIGYDKFFVVFLYRTGIIQARRGVLSKALEVVAAMFFDL